MGVRLTSPAASAASPLRERALVPMIAASASPSLRVAHAPRSLSRRGSSSRFVPGRRSLRAVARATEDSADDDTPPPGCSRYEVRIKKPLGLVLEEDKTGKIFVAEILEDSNAARAGLINVGDQLLATSAMVFNSAQDYGGVSVKKGEETIGSRRAGRISRPSWRRSGRSRARGWSRSSSRSAYEARHERIRPCDIRVVL